jgi:tetratricopeptide (TPR) repeat protein
MPTPAETLALARRLHRSGDLAGAARLYCQVVEAEPDHADALSLLALACHQSGDLAGAEEWYRRALAARPGDAENHFRLGLVLAALGRADAAAGGFREAVRLRPDSAEAWNNLGNALFLQDRAGEAVPCYREAVRIRPDYAEAWLNLGNALREDDRLTEGLTSYREAVRLRPAYARAHMNLAAALLETGEVGAAEGHLRECLRLSPGAPQVLHTLADNGLFRDGDPGPDELRARLARGGLSPADAAHLHSTLAHLLDRAGRYDDAFAHFREANRLRRDLARQAGTAFDPAEHVRLVDRLVAVFTPEYFERVRGLGSPAEEPVFVVGMPRSGSSLVEQILSHHPDVAGAGELRDFPRLVATLPERLSTAGPYPECVGRLDGPAALALADAYLGRVRERVGPALRFTDKMLENFLHLGLVATLLPRARVVHCRRDPLDTCVSCFFQKFRGVNYTCDLEELGLYYRQYQRLMAHWRTALPLPVLEVAYEELVADSEAGSRRLIDFCGLPWDERVLRFHENPRPVRTVSKLQVRRPIYSSSLGRWRRYAAHLAPLCQALGLEELTPATPPAESRG